jgi:hypothetical protein
MAVGVFNSRKRSVIERPDRVEVEFDVDGDHYHYVANCEYRIEWNSVEVLKNARHISDRNWRRFHCA